MNKHLEPEFITLLDNNQNLIHKVCRLYTVDEASHKDLFQEISIQLWNAYPKFRGDAKFTTWAYRIALNTAISLYRKKKRSIDTTSIDFSIHKFEYTEYNEEEEEQLKAMYKALQELNDIEKALVFLYLEDKNYDEIAETLGISSINARVKMNRIKTKLKQLLNP
ncbi:MULTISPECIES: RNA polymerase sigma factor [Myroides]|uniref:Sigma-70 family RNA polymerase sigma factor n=1 Tax=Myroides albus TaxID=2562892 RepID=A0A6I3LHQ4_9FLAO|nr:MULTISPECIES: sigma-70 family RNA polymerase sigma factor [Myroides]MTG97773.1 sigma-70 family RNA polymerase sigma factor [Myroides albus]MVX35543.1 sigma-70 family RNA polymerase sigma factor [Myroides sp. LoEW2-1]UVD79729.1 sigma-70 family RNA polymerase sigma factor [Myroides albus]